jgi:hypothetical protein
VPVAGKRHLITPEGPVYLEERDRIFLTREQLTALSFLHEWAFKYQLTIVCKNCNSAVRGQNSDGEINQGKHPSVSCQCREWVYDPSRPRG